MTTTRLLARSSDAASLIFDILHPPFSETQPTNHARVR